MHVSRLEQLKGPARLTGGYCSLERPIRPSCGPPFVCLRRKWTAVSPQLVPYFVEVCQKPQHPALRGGWGRRLFPLVRASPKTWQHVLTPGWLPRMRCSFLNGRCGLTLAIEGRIPWLFKGTLSEGTVLLSELWGNITVHSNPFRTHHPAKTRSSAKFCLTTHTAMLSYV